MVVWNPIQVLLSDMPLLLLEIVTDVLRTQPDLQVVGSVGAEESLLDAVRRTNADFVIASGRNPTIEEYHQALYAQSRLKVLELASKDGHGWLHELRLSRVALGEMSPLELPNVIRASVRPTPELRVESSKRLPISRKNLESKE